MPRKIVLIGAGSAMFTQGLVADLVLSDRPWKLGLVDTDPEALEVARQLAERMVRVTRAQVTIEASTDRCALLCGADIVVTTIGVGGRRAWEADFQIPRKYGVFQPVADTAMAGGISRALRMIPAMVEIATDVARLAPDALFFNYANPMSVICGAVRRATTANIVGLCIGVHHVQEELAALAGIPAGEASALAAGLNHFTFIYDLRWMGRDAWPLVRENLQREVGGAVLNESDLDAPGGDTPLVKRRRVLGRKDNPFSWSLFDTYGAYPAANDRHVVEFLPERFPQGAYFGRQLGVDVFPLEDTIAHGDAIYQKMRAQAFGQAPLDKEILDRSSGEHSQLLQVLAAIDGDTRRTFSANLPNQGTVPNLPADAVLETTCVATARGLRAIHVPDMSDVLAALLYRKISAQRITMEAALTGDRGLFVEALLADGCISDARLAGKLADDLLRAQHAYLPQFA
jgi:alpha-galactosidase